MTTITEKVSSNASKGRVTFICDFSPARGADSGYLEQAKGLDVDFICVVYNPGKSVRMDSAVAAYTIRQYTKRDVIFILSTRDTNKLALQSHLLGAASLGLENVVVLQGDKFTQRELSKVKEVSDFTPTQLIKSIKSMNDGTDYKGLKLTARTSFCVGAVIDVGKGMEAEARLAYEKYLAGADFFLAQSVYSIEQIERFRKLYRDIAHDELFRPLFCSVQMLEKEGVILGTVPEKILRDLDRGKPGTDIALELLHHFVEHGIKTVYLIPPVRKGGARNYEAAQEVLSLFRGG